MKKKPRKKNKPGNKKWVRRKIRRIKEHITAHPEDQQAQLAYTTMLKNQSLPPQAWEPMPCTPKPCPKTLITKRSTTLMDLWVIQHKKK